MNEGAWTQISVRERRGGGDRKRALGRPRYLDGIVAACMRLQRPHVVVRVAWSFESVARQGARLED